MAVVMAAVATAEMFLRRFRLGRWSIGMTAGFRLRSAEARVWLCIAAGIGWRVAVFVRHDAFAQRRASARKVSAALCCEL